MRKFVHQKSLRYFVLSLISLLFFVSCKHKEAENKNKLVNIQDKLDELKASNNIPGINVSFIDSDDKLYNFSSGLENVTKGTNLNNSYTLLSGSIGKTYAAAIVFQLIDDKKLSLEDKIVDFLPKEDWLDSIPNFNQLTVEMLLSHTSGLPRWVTKPAVWDSLSNNPNKVWSYKDRLRLIFEDEAVHEPGKDWSYSDTNYILLGLLIESIEKRNYYDVLTSNILQPNKLSETYPATKRNIQNLAMGYSELPESFKIPKETSLSNGDYIFNPQMEWTGGGVASSTSDLAKWCKKYYSGKLFSQNLLTKMTTVNPNGEKVYHDKHSYGMGSFIYQSKWDAAFGHTGFMPGFNSIIVYYPNKNITIALQINCDYATKKMDLITYADIMVECFISQTTS